ncbi:MAG: GNAT family N-acetyltransferase [Candidatus Thorarchaeota archaeon]|nr:GNAT family N-acetyltransferase [Candidatus Thorarchaeota archaeon]
MVEIREAREEDRESVGRVLWRAFEATENFEDVQKLDWLKHWHQPQKHDWAYVAVDNNKVVSNFCFFVTDDDIIRGNPVMFGGVWAVATEPQYRRRGLVKSLFDVSFEKMHREGAVLSILDPFSRPFYEQFGYALAEKRAKHVFSRHQLKYVKGPSNITSYEAMDSKDFEKARKVERSMARFGSRFFIFERTWNEIMKRGNLHILERDSEPVGTVQFSFQKPSSGHGYNLQVGLTRYTSDDVFLSILELVYNSIPSVQTITWWTDAEVPLRHFFLDHNAETFQIGSMMMRVIDLEGYCKSIRIPKHVEEEVTIELNDSQCPWNSGVYTLSPMNGTLTAERVNRTPDIVLSEFQLSKVISGMSPAKLLQAFGEIKCSKDIATRLEAIFPADTFLSYIRF